MNSSGNIVEEYNYDPWGRRRNPADWSYTNVATPTYTQHGFTGHEHLDMFNLINMKGRIYDSEIARLLSPDPIIQNPYNLLNYNRYSYCLNNPLKYFDPSGYSREAILREWEWEQQNTPGPDQLYNNYVDYWGGLQQSYKDRYTYEEIENNRNEKEGEDTNSNTEPEKQNPLVWIPGIPFPIPVLTDGIWSIGASGTISAGLIGFSIEFGILIDFKEGISVILYISLGHAIGGDASFGAEVNYYEPSGKSLTFNDLKGWSESYNVGIWFIDGSFGGNSKNNGLRIQTYSDMHLNYKSFGGGGSVPLPIGFTRKKTYTWIFFNNNK